MKILKRVLMFIIIIILVIEIPSNNIIVNSSVIPTNPIKIGVFLHSSDEYLSLVKQNLEAIQSENQDKVQFVFFNAKENQSIQN